MNGNAVLAGRLEREAFDLAAADGGLVKGRLADRFKDMLESHAPGNKARDRCAVHALQTAIKALNPERRPTVAGSDEDYLRMTLDLYRGEDLDDASGSPWWTNAP